MTDKTGAVVDEIHGIEGCSRGKEPDGIIKTVPEAQQEAAGIGNRIRAKNPGRSGGRKTGKERVDGLRHRFKINPVERAEECPVAHRVAFQDEPSDRVVQKREVDDLGSSGIRSPALVIKHDGTSCPAVTCHLHHTFRRARNRRRNSESREPFDG